MLTVKPCTQQILTKKTRFIVETTTILIQLIVTQSKHNDQKQHFWIWYTKKTWIFSEWLVLQPAYLKFLKISLLKLTVYNFRVHSDFQEDGWVLKYFRENSFIFRCWMRNSILESCISSSRRTFHEYYVYLIKFLNVTNKPPQIWKKTHVKFPPSKFTSSLYRIEYNTFHLLMFGISKSWRTIYGGSRNQVFSPNWIDFPGRIINITKTYQTSKVKNVAINAKAKIFSTDSSFLITRKV